MPEKLHSSEQITAFLNELKTQSDRGVAVIAAAVLDEILQMLILARLIKIGADREDALFWKTGAPLSSLSSKIELTFALGTISNEARIAAHLIRDIRNKFAHRIDALTFDHPLILDLFANRAAPSVNAMPVTTREKFLALFQGLSIILYGTLSADIRIKSIEETHIVHTINMIIEALKAAGGTPVPEINGINNGEPPAHARIASRFSESDKFVSNPSAGAPVDSALADSALDLSSPESRVCQVHNRQSVSV